MAWAEDYRQDWIAETLRVFGYINREHLVRKFGISVPQASNDLVKFTRDRPGLMSYDSSAKRYVSADRLPSKWVKPTDTDNLPAFAAAIEKARGHQGPPEQPLDADIDKFNCEPVAGGVLISRRTA